MTEQGETVEPDEGQAYVPGSVVPVIVDGNKWAACFGLSWADMLLYDQANSGRIIRPGGTYFRRVAGTMGVAAARNQHVASFLSTDAEWLFMVDTDMGFSADTVDRMVASATANRVQVLGGLAFSQVPDKDLASPEHYAQRFRIRPTLYSYVRVESTGEVGFRPITKYRRDAFQKVAGTGAAILLVHREVLESVGPDPFMPITDPNGAGQGVPRTFSEDLSFSIRVQGAGHDIGVDTSIKTTHDKGGIFLDETTYAMQEETLIQAKGHEIARLAQVAARSGQLYTQAGLIVPSGAMQ